MLSLKLHLYAGIFAYFSPSIKIYTLHKKQPLSIAYYCVLFSNGFVHFLFFYHLYQSLMPLYMQVKQKHHTET